MYYLRSRYYTPDFFRFINTDSVIDKNLYCYCYCNPVLFDDPTGHLLSLAIPLITTIAKALVATIVAGCAVSAGKKIGTGVKNGSNRRNYDDQYKDEINRSIDIYGVGNAISDAITRAQKDSPEKWNPKPENHHIVARNAEGAQKAQNILNKAHININSDPANQVPISAQLHRHLHTDIYYTAINEVMGFVDKTNSIIYGTNNIYTLQSGIYIALYTIKGLLIIGDEILWEDQYVD